ncbi:MAG: ROK family protein [Lentisphaeraceae bacterium]|nr:ROK family protein [Lentisphaeraceae bacterium]
MVTKEKSLNQQSAAVYNRLLILRLLRKHRQLTRTQLAEVTRLQNSTMSYIIRDFLNRGIVVESGKRESGAGNKKQTWLQVNPRLGWVIGIVIQNVYAELVKVDYSGKIIDSCNFEVSEDITTLPAYLKDRLEQWYADRGRPPGPMRGLCLGLPATVDPEVGIIENSKFFNVIDYPIADDFNKLFPSSSIIIDNDVRQAALAEYHSEGFNLSNFLFFYTNYEKAGEGFKPGYFGSSLFVDGEMMNGVNSSAGELTGILRPNDPPLLSVQDLEDLKNINGPLTSSLKGLGHWILPWIEALASYSDPGSIVMGGSMCWQNEKLLEMMNDLLNSRLNRSSEREMKIIRAQSPVQGVAYGAAITLLDHLSPELINQ